MFYWIKKKGWRVEQKTDAGATRSGTRLNRFHIPIASTLFNYYRVYRRYIGYRIIPLLAITVAGTYVEGFGIALFLPLLFGPETVLNADNNIASVIQTIFAGLGLEVTMIGVAIVGLLTFLVKGGLKFAEGAYQSHITANIIYRDMRKHLVQVIAGMNYNYYAKSNTGYLTNVVTQEVARAAQSFNYYSQAIVQLVTVATYFCIIIFLDWELTLMAAGYGIVILYCFRFLSRQSKKYSRLHSKDHGIFLGLMVQSIQAFKYLVSTNLFPQLKGRSFEAIDKLSHYRFRVNLATATLRGVSELLVVLFIILAVVYRTVLLDMSPSLTFGSLMILFRMMMSVMMFQNFWQQFSGLIGGLDTVKKTLKQVGDAKEPMGTLVKAKLLRGIRFQNVSFDYGEGNVLHDLNLDFPKNKTVALVGESGSGKSTIVDLITGVLKPTQGTVMFDDTDGKEIDFTSLRRHIGYVTQENALFDDSVANNISMWGCGADDAECAEKIRKACRQAYCEEFILAMPEQYDTPIGDRGVRLSGGQRQRLAIARELFRTPEVLLLDEATSALDSESEQFIRQSIDALKGTMTVIIIAHRLSTIRNCDTIYVLDQGRVVEQGDFHQLMARENSQFARMCALQNITA